jgi:hypothetical protein
MSVTPDIGARTSAGSIFSDPIDRDFPENTPAE